MALYLGHLAATGQAIASIEKARAAISHFHAAAGMQKGDNLACHPTVVEAVKGWRNRAPVSRQANALTTEALNQSQGGMCISRVVSGMAGQFVDDGANTQWDTRAPVRCEPKM